MSSTLVSSRCPCPDHVSLYTTHQCSCTDFLFLFCDQPNDGYCHWPKHVVGFICKRNLCLELVHLYFLLEYV